MNLASLPQTTLKVPFNGFNKTGMIIRYHIPHTIEASFLEFLEYLRPASTTVEE